MHRNVTKGYEEEICLRCENRVQLVEYDKLTIWQRPNLNSKLVPPEGWIESISVLGEVEVVFSRAMKTNFNASLFLNSTNIDMYVLPFENWHLERDDFNMSSLNFTWNCTSFSGRTLRFKLKFNDAAEISPLLNQDVLYINLTMANELGLLSSVEGMPLRKVDTEMLGKIRRQMEDTTWNSNFVSASSTAGASSEGLLIGSLLLNFVFAGAFTYMVQWIHSMQMIIHLPMMRIPVPSNVSAYFQTVVPVITFDVLPSDYTTELLLEFDR